MEISGQLCVLAALPPVNSPWYPQNRSLNVFQSWYGHYEQEINLLSLQGFEPRIIQPIAQSLYAILLWDCIVTYLCLDMQHRHKSE